MPRKKNGETVKTFRPMPKEKIKFENKLEIYIHKIVSSLSYGQEINLNVEDNPSFYIYAAKKSAYYNCMEDLKVVLSKDRKSIKLYMEI